MALRAAGTWPPPTTPTHPTVLAKAAPNPSVAAAMPGEPGTAAPTVPTAPNPTLCRGAEVSVGSCRPAGCPRPTARSLP